MGEGNEKQIEKLKEEKEAIEETKLVVEHFDDENYLISYRHENLSVLLNYIDKLEKENEELKEEDKYKLALFMIIRTNRILPAGKMLKKTDYEINAMTYLTMCELFKMIDFKKAKEMYKEGEKVGKKLKNE